MRSPKKRSLLDVNEHFEGEHNDKIHFFFSLVLFCAWVCMQAHAAFSGL